MKERKRRTMKRFLVFLLSFAMVFSSFGFGVLSVQAEETDDKSDSGGESGDSGEYGKDYPEDYDSTIYTIGGVNYYIWNSNQSGLYCILPSYDTDGKVKGYMTYNTYSDKDSLGDGESVDEGYVTLASGLDLSGGSSIIAYFVWYEAGAGADNEGATVTPVTSANSFIYGSWEEEESLDQVLTFTKLDTSDTAVAEDAETDGLYRVSASACDSMKYIPVYHTNDTSKVNGFVAFSVYGGSSGGSGSQGDGSDPAQYDSYITIDGVKYYDNGMGRTGLRFIYPKYQFENAAGTVASGISDSVVTPKAAGYLSDGQDQEGNEVVLLGSTFTLDVANYGRTMYVVWYQAADGDTPAAITPVDLTDLEVEDSAIVELSEADMDFTDGLSDKFRKGLIQIRGLEEGNTALCYKGRNADYLRAQINVTDQSAHVEQPTIKIDGVTYRLPDLVDRETCGTYAVKAAVDENGTVTGYDKSAVSEDGVVTLSNSLSVGIDEKVPYYLFHYESEVSYDEENNQVIQATLTPITEPDKEFDDWYAQYITKGRFTVTEAEMTEGAPFEDGAWWLEGKSPDTCYVTYVIDYSTGYSKGERSLTIIVGDGNSNDDPYVPSDYYTRFLVKGYGKADGSKPEDTDKVDVYDEGYSYRRAAGYSDSYDMEKTPMVIRVADADYNVLTYSESKQILRLVNSEYLAVTYYDKESVAAAGTDDPREADLSGKDVTSKVLSDYTWTGGDAEAMKEACFLQFSPDKDGYYVISYRSSDSGNSGDSTGTDTGSGSNQEGKTSDSTGSTAVASTEGTASTSSAGVVSPKTVNASAETAVSGSSSDTSSGDSSKGSYEYSEYNDGNANKSTTYSALIRVTSSEEPVIIVNQAVQQVMAAISALPEAAAVTLNDEGKIAEAKRAYEALGEDRQYVTKEMTEKLEAVEKAIADLKKAEEEKKSDETGEKTDETGEKTDETGEKTDETGEKTDETGEKTDETGEKTDETGEKTDETGEKTDEAGEKTDEAGEKTDETGEKTDETGEEEKVDDEEAIRRAAEEAAARKAAEEAAAKKAAEEAAAKKAAEEEAAKKAAEEAVAKKAAENVTVGTETTDDSGATFVVTESSGSETVQVEYKAAESTEKKVVIPSTVTVNGVEAVVTSISDSAFEGNKTVTTISIPSTVEEIGDGAFKGCTNLKTVSMSSNTKEIGASAFSGCKNLKSITIPSKVTSIGKSAFSGCSSLTKVTIPKKVTTVGKNAFSGCSSLTTVNVKSTSIKKIEQGAFKNCKKLKKVTLTKNVTSIGKDAFSGDKKLKTITIKSTKIKSVGANAFKNVPKTATIKVPKKQKKAYTKLLKKAGFKGKIK